MKFNVRLSFQRIYKKLPQSEKEAIDKKIADLFDYYSRHVLYAGLRVRKISGHDNYFEIDTASNRRILIRKQHDLIEFIAYGNHDEIKQFFKEGKINERTIQLITSWRYSGFNVDNHVYIGYSNRDGLEGLVQYVARAPLSQEKILFGRLRR